MDFAYSAERSIEDGIESMSNAEMITVIISYIVMFIYIAIALGKIRSFKNFLVKLIIVLQFHLEKNKKIIFQIDSKIVLAIGGIAIVLISVLCSLGFFGYLGVETTMVMFYIFQKILP
jgi:Niemann-Pick C1 protein